MSESDSSFNGDSGFQVDEKNRHSRTEFIEEDEKAKKEVDGESDIGGPPIDRGWAWVVLGACVLAFGLYGGMMRSFGVFFLQYQKRFNSNASETAIMNLIQNVVLSTAALFVMTIGLQKFSSRVSVFIGGTLTVAAYLTTAFTKDIRVFYFAQGVLGGAGLALIHPPMLAIIGVYFKRHRGLANSIFTSGGSLGGFIFAPVVVKLFKEYQYSGALLIISGIIMNILVAALLMRPIESYTKKELKLQDEATEITEEDQLFMKEEHNHDHGDNKKLMFDEIKIESEVFKSGPDSVINKKPVDFTRMQSYDPTMIDSKSQESPLLQRVRAHSFGVRRHRTISENKYESEGNIHHGRNILKGIIGAISKSQAALYTSGDGVCGSFVDINMTPSVYQEKTAIATVVEDIGENETPRGCCLKMKACLLSVLGMVFDLSLLRNPVFLTFLLMGFSIVSGVTLLPVYIPTHANDIGISNEQIGLLISIMAVIDLVSKISVGVITDRQLIKRSTILMIVTFVLGTTSHLVRFVTTFSTMVVFVVIAGICCGQYLSMYAVLLMDVIGPEKFKSSLGFGTLVHGTSIAVFFPITGLLRDMTGSYVASFHLLGGLSYLAGILAFSIPIVNKWKKNKTAKQSTDIVDKT